MAELKHGKYIVIKNNQDIDNALEHIGQRMREETDIEKMEAAVEFAILSTNREYIERKGTDVQKIISACQMLIKYGFRENTPEQILERIKEKIK